LAEQIALGFGQFFITGHRMESRAGKRQGEMEGHMVDCRQGNHRPECPILDDMAKPAPRGKRLSVA
jgi:hypothetical protein